MAQCGATMYFRTKWSAQLIQEPSTHTFHLLGVSCMLCLAGPHISGYSGRASLLGTWLWLTSVSSSW